MQDYDARIEEYKHEITGLKRNLQAKDIESHCERSRASSMMEDAQADRLMNEDVASCFETDEPGEPINELEQLRMSNTGSLDQMQQWMNNSALINELVEEKDYAEINSPTNMSREEQKYEPEHSPLASNGKKLAFFGSEAEPSLLQATRASSLLEMSDSRKEPEEEYFRLSCLALKIIYNNQDQDFSFM